MQESPLHRKLEPLNLYHVNWYTFYSLLKRFSLVWIQIDNVLHLFLDSALVNFVQTFSAAEGFVRGRSYNIRLDDQVLLKFSPKNSDSTYYFSDMVNIFMHSWIMCTSYEINKMTTLWLQIGGTLTFFHEEGARRCLEVSGLSLAAEI
jgi:hypothetical protein